MFTSDTRTGANASSNMASNVSAVSGETQGSNFSETGRKSHSEQMTDKSKDTDFEGRLGQIQGASSRLLPVGVCILALVVMAVLVLIVFSTSFPPKPTRPAVGHLGSSCRKSSSCLGKALCIDGVCRCEGPDLRIVEGACVPAVTAETEEPPLSEKVTTTSQ
ncbi:hypothetical protein HPB51_004867 [Rhipicephalus microplus]|uniref:EB domain-containing protein n=1 Tax=Rhipicephalus microplus TaxID=6941 RepID=A0A9J6E6X5_RHIMP|nr:hypothetical protein HPB51_004867 [Rhipicephalus microplus]